MCPPSPPPSLPNYKWRGGVGCGLQTGLLLLGGRSASPFPRSPGREALTGDGRKQGKGGRRRFFGKGGLPIFSPSSSLCLDPTRGEGERERSRLRRRGCSYRGGRGDVTGGEARSNPVGCSVGRSVGLPSPIIPHHHHWSLPPFSFRIPHPSGALPWRRRWQLALNPPSSHPPSAVDPTRKKSP